jgi:hypothetical protein
VSRREKRVREAHPEVVSLFIKPQIRHRFEIARKARFGDG